MLELLFATKNLTDQLKVTFPEVSEYFRACDYISWSKTLPLVSVFIPNEPIEKLFICILNETSFGALMRAGGEDRRRVKRPSSA